MELSDQMSSVEASRARILARQERARVLRGREVLCGGHFIRPFLFFDPDTQSWRTFQCSIDGDLIEYSHPFPRSGMMLNGILYPLDTLEPATSDGDCSSWPTPAAIDANPPTKLRASATETRSMSLAQKVEIWPTPTAKKANLKDMMEQSYDWEMRKAILYPTPRGSEGGVGLCGGEGSRNMLIQLLEDGRITEDEMLSMQSGSGGRLNPQWVEWLMGFPSGWTELDVSEMP